MKLKDLFEDDSQLEINPKLVQLIKDHCFKNFLSIVSGKCIVLYRADTRQMALLGSDSDLGDIVGFNSKPTSKSDQKGLFSNTNLDKATFTSEKWKDIPNRKTSVFCSPSPNKYELFGDLYIVIPYDDVESMAFTPTDFNEITPKGSDPSPADMGVKVKTFSNLTSIPEESEVWFEGGFIAIGSQDYMPDEIIGSSWLKELEKQVQGKK